MQATKVYVHCDGFYLLDWHVRRVLPGNPIPREYRVHSSEIDEAKGSVNLLMTNGGSTIDTEKLAAVLRRCKIFGKDIDVGTFGEAEIPDQGALQ